MIYYPAFDTDINAKHVTFYKEDGTVHFDFNITQLCLNCGEILYKDELMNIEIPLTIISGNNYFINKKTEKCPICNSRNIFPCDPLISETIKTLNQNGFRTFACCSGHNYSFNKHHSVTPTFIVFDDFLLQKKDFLLEKFKKSDLIEEFGLYYTGIGKRKYMNGKYIVLTTLSKENIEATKHYTGYIPIRDKIINVLYDEAFFESITVTDNENIEEVQDKLIIERNKKLNKFISNLVIEWNDEGGN